MEPVSVGALVAALIAKALDRTEDKAVDGAFEVGEAAVEALRQRFIGDPEVEGAIEGVVTAPGDPDRSHALGAVLAERASSREEVLAQLRSIAERIEATGVQVGKLVQLAEGNGNVQVGRVDRSVINIGPGQVHQDRD